MRSITFIETRTVNDGTGTVFEAGKTYDLAETSCERWIRRGAARYAEEKASAVATSAIVIPENWRDLEWTELRALAKQVNEDVRTKEDAIAAIELELGARQQ